MNGTETVSAPRPPTLEEVQKLAGPDDIIEALPNGEYMIRAGARNKPKPVMLDVSDKHVDKMARGFILGTESVGRNNQIRMKLEERVIKRIGQKGKLLTDRLFELIDGVYVVDNVGGKSVRYYKVPPSLPAIIYALNRALGTPKQTMEREESKKGILVVEHIIKNLAAPTPVPHRDVTEAQ